MRLLLILALVTSTASADPISVNRSELAPGAEVVATSRHIGIANKQVIHVWRRNGALFQIHHMKSTSSRAVLTSRMKALPGTWTVDVYIDLGPRVGRTTFIVR